jgi:glycosyltransferase involved in cell wall biosynthesis
MNLGIDASTVGSGGAQRHLIEILNCFNPCEHGFSKIKIWGPQSILDQIPNTEYLIKFSHPLLNTGLFNRIFWQLFFRDNQFKGNIDVLINPFGTYLGNFRPYITMSQNMLVFDKEEQKRFGFSFYRLKFKLLFYIQRASFNNAQGLIFLSEYAKKNIEKYVDYSKCKTSIIHHGISAVFIKEPAEQLSISNYSLQNPYEFLYVSTVFGYKHQLQVVEVISRLRKKGYPVIIKLVGGIGQKKIGKMLQKKCNSIDPEKDFIIWHQHVDLKGVVSYYHNCDGFIFASSCENMPNILIEAMASGLPIACSSSNPMHEFLEEAGLYFDPSNLDELEEVLEKMLNNKGLRTEISHRAFTNSKKYSWAVCANKTFDFLHFLS